MTRSTDVHGPAILPGRFTCLEEHLMDRMLLTHKLIAAKTLLERTQFPEGISDTAWNLALIRTSAVPESLAAETDVLPIVLQAIKDTACEEPGETVVRIGDFDRVVRPLVATGMRFLTVGDVEVEVLGIDDDRVRFAVAGHDGETDLSLHVVRALVRNGRMQELA